MLLAWTLLAAAIVYVLGVIPNRRRLRREEDTEKDAWAGWIDRRTTSRDRRVGLPDPREARTERRRGPSDRRHGPAAMA